MEDFNILVTMTLSSLSTFLMTPPISYLLGFIFMAIIIKLFGQLAHITR